MVLPSLPWNRASKITEVFFKRLKSLHESNHDRDITVTSPQRIILGSLKGHRTTFTSVSEVFRALIQQYMRLHMELSNMTVDLECILGQKHDQLGRVVWKVPYWIRMVKRWSMEGLTTQGGASSGVRCAHLWPCDGLWFCACVASPCPRLLVCTSKLGLACACGVTTVSADLQVRAPTVTKDRNLLLSDTWSASSWAALADVCSEFEVADIESASNVAYEPT